MKDQVVLVSLDGMPAKVFENAWKYHSSDIHVQELWTVYPSITVPAHVSILTGKSPQEHGITENLVMEGPGFEKISLYRPTVEEARRIMPEDTVVHEFAAAGLKCASINWPLGDGLPGKNHSEELTTHEEAEGVQAAYEKDQRALKLLKHEMETGDKDFIAAHFEEYDGAAHIYGVEGERTVLACDHMVAYAEELLRTAKSCGVEKMIFFSDHGMLDKEENFFPNIYAMEHGFEGEIREGRMIFLADGSGCMQFFSDLSEETDEAVIRCMEESGKIQAVSWLKDGEERVCTQPQRSAACGRLRRPRAILEMKRGFCSEDIMERSEEKYHDMRGLHGYDPEHVRQMNGFFLAYDPGQRLGLKDGARLGITDITPMIRTLVMEGRT